MCVHYRMCMFEYIVYIFPLRFSTIYQLFFFSFCFLFWWERKRGRNGEENLCTQFFMILGFRNPFHRVYFVFPIFFLPPPTFFHSFFLHSQRHLVRNEMILPKIQFGGSCKLSSWRPLVPHFRKGFILTYEGKFLISS